MFELYVWLSIAIGLSAGAINFKRDCQQMFDDLGDMLVALAMSMAIAVAITAVGIPLLLLWILVMWLISHPKPHGDIDG